MSDRSEPRQRVPQPGKPFSVSRIRFRSGERYSFLLREGMPVYLAVLFVNRFRTKGRAANTLHQVCSVLALLHNDLDSRGIDLRGLLAQGRFLSLPDIHRFADSAQYVASEPICPQRGKKSRVVNIEKARLRATTKAERRQTVDSATYATRLRYARAYLSFTADYVRSTLPSDLASQLAEEAERGLDALSAHIPRVSRRAKLGARQGLTHQEESLLLDVIDLESPRNPWRSEFVRTRNRLIVILLLASGMRRGELLGLQVKDLSSHQAKLKILRRADAAEDARLHQPNTKTGDREIPIAPNVLSALIDFIRTQRHKIKAARKIPQLFISDEGDALSLSSINQIFVDIRNACPELPKGLTAHTLRHTWNERFSELADRVGMPEVEEQSARALQQGWADGSKMAAVYTRRHTASKAQELSLKLQHALEEQINASN